MKDRLIIYYLLKENTKKKESKIINFISETESLNTNPKLKDLKKTMKIKTVCEKKLIK